MELPKLGRALCKLSRKKRLIGTFWGSAVFWGLLGTHGRRGATVPPTPDHKISSAAYLREAYESYDMIHSISYSYDIPVILLKFLFLLKFRKHSLNNELNSFEESSSGI